MIEDHHRNLCRRSDNRQRAAFEAAWIAHAITDGLTPAHHYPLSDKIEELWVSQKKSDSARRKISFAATLIAKPSERTGSTGVPKEFLRRMSLFELGIATSIKPHVSPMPDEQWLLHAESIGIAALFGRSGTASVCHRHV